MSKDPPQVPALLVRGLSKLPGLPAPKAPMCSWRQRRMATSKQQSCQALQFSLITWSRQGLVLFPQISDDWRGDGETSLHCLPAELGIQSGKCLGFRQPAAHADCVQNSSVPDSKQKTAEGPPCTKQGGSRSPPHLWPVLGNCRVKFTLCG